MQQLRWEGSHLDSLEIRVGAAQDAHLDAGRLSRLVYANCHMVLRVGSHSIRRNYGIQARKNKQVNNEKTVTKFS